MVSLTKNVPAEAGVYLFRDRKNKVIYVGKAINLKARVSSYFQKNLGNAKSALLVERIAEVDYFKVMSEFEALLLEAKLIKKYQPYFNSQLKDDKDYLYIKITSEDFPKVLTVRKKSLEAAKIYFGPFPNATQARSTLKLARRIFPFRTTCQPNSARACLNYHIGLCPGVCIGAISSKDYQKQIRRLRGFLNGNTGEITNQLHQEMLVLARQLRFEEAAKIKNSLVAIKATTRPIEDVERYLSGPDVLEGVYQTQIRDLAAMLNLDQDLVRIECYDISHISGTNTVGSMVVFHNGAASKDDYRRFRIKTVPGINDPAQLAEVLSRRFHNDWPHPQLIIVDGGRTQLNAAKKALEKLDLGIPVFGLAKRFEEVYIPGQVRTLRFQNNSPALHLLQRLRDEAHRFAISYHRYLRSKEALTR